MRVVSFNVQNMRLRGSRLDGARDRDMPEDLGPAAPLLDDYDRRLTAKVLAEAEADMVALQEVFDQQTLDHFHDAYLLPTGTAPYPFRACLPGNDGRGLDVALLSRIAPRAITGHAALTPDDLALTVPAGINPHAPLFRRDCLEIGFDALTLFICHFKAPYPDVAATWPIRNLEAQAVRRLIERRFATPETENWLILGDLNRPRAEDPDALAPLTDGFGLDLLNRLPKGTRWSYHNAHEGFTARPDALIASPALAAHNPDAVPRLIRSGLGYEAAAYTGDRLATVGTHRPHASDHAALVIDLDVS
ncbi:MAG: endonuclease/exonuclease/phosphatase family protein [Rhodobacteraceae bacterium]|nr:endonuclease/exonuclease/phosphatase family protein [Paracoccaceae bacterium]MCW9042997.1 endonuclease/exonuclease/phosphatase family protein [Pseudopelagicola sp.]